MNPLTKNSWDIPRNPPLLHQFFGLIFICEKTKFEVKGTTLVFYQVHHQVELLGNYFSFLTTSFKTMCLNSTYSFVVIMPID
jgi:hypothetical protein